MKKHYLALIIAGLLFGINLRSNAQINNHDKFYSDCKTEIFYEAEIMPEPKKGNEQILKFLKDKIDIKDTDNGKLSILINTNCNGETKEIKVLSDLEAYKNETILEFIENLKFKPAQQRGHKVNCTFQYNINYVQGNFISIKAEAPDFIKSKMKK